MKNIIKSLLIVVAVAAVAGGATYAYFSATQISTGNTFSSGTLDLTVDNFQGPQVVHITRAAMVPQPHWSHNYGGQWVLKNTGSIPGTVSATIQNMQNGTTTCGAPKVAALAAASLPACVTNSPTGGQLGALMFGAWGLNQAPWGALSSVYTPLNTMNGVVIPLTGTGFSGTLNSGQSIAADLDLEWDTHAGTLDNTAQGDTLSFDIVFTLNQ